MCALKSACKGATGSASAWLGEHENSYPIKTSKHQLAPNYTDSSQRKMLESLTQIVDHKG
jgi:hypothetical protein